MSPEHDPPAEYRYNKIRNVSGAYRLTLVIDALRNASMTSESEPLTAHIPIHDGIWCVFDVAQYDSQLLRVLTRHQMAQELPIDVSVIGEYPVSLQDKQGSAIVTIPKQLYDDIGLDKVERATNIAVAPGLLLVVSETMVDPSRFSVPLLVNAGRRFSWATSEVPTNLSENT